MANPMSVRLHINIDHVATVRNARGTRYPDPVFAAGLCEAAGADGITAEEMLRIAERVCPDVITLVPERREERTTEGGLDVFKQRGAIESVIAMAKEKGIKMSLFINADEKVVEASKELGVAQIELHTGEYCHATGAKVAEELGRIERAAARAHALGLEVAAGHGLTRHNVGPVVAIPEVGEVNIGHSVIADAVFFGLDRAVRDLRYAIVRGATNRKAV
jgi:pyridoxine 5-phosphate synthase